MLLIIFMNCCFAAALPLLKYALEHINPFLLVALRMIGAGAVLCGMHALSDAPVVRTQLNTRLIVMNGILSMCLLCLLESWALQGMSATKANLMWATLPLFTAVAVRLWNHHPLYAFHAGAIGLGMLGIACLVMPEIIRYGTQACSSCSVWHDASMLAAVCAAACGYICTEQLVAEQHPIFLTNGISMLLGGVLSLIVSYSALGTSSFAYTNLYHALGFIGLIIAIVNVIGLSLQMLLVQTHSVILLALSSFITPLCGALFGILQGDVWDHWLLGAALCIGSGLGIVHHYDTKRITHACS